MTLRLVSSEPSCPVCLDLLRVRWSVLDGRMRGAGVAACPACVAAAGARLPLPVFHLRPYHDVPRGAA